MKLNWVDVNTGEIDIQKSYGLTLRTPYNKLKLFIYTNWHSKSNFVWKSIGFILIFDLYKLTMTQINSNNVSSQMISIDCMYFSEKEKDLQKLTFEIKIRLKIN